MSDRAQRAFGGIVLLIVICTAVIGIVYLKTLIRFLFGMYFWLIIGFGQWLGFAQ